MTKQTLAAAGRVLLLLAGLGVVAFLVQRAGPAKVGAILKDAWVFLPVLALLEIGMVSFDVSCVRAQLGEHAKKIPLRSWIWSSTYAYGLQILFPAGRAAGEVARISVLQRHVGVARCAVASVGFQGANLFAVSLISGVHALLSWLFAAEIARGLALGEAINFVLVMGIAAFVTMTLRSKRATTMVAARFKLNDDSRGELEDATQRSLAISRGALLCFLGRATQWLQYAVCVAAIGGKTGLVQSSLAHGTQLVGATLGDVIPGQVGVVESAYATFAEPLQLTPDRVLALPLLIRVTQISLAMTSLLVATVMGRKPSP